MTTTLVYYHYDLDNLQPQIRKVVENDNDDSEDWVQFYLRDDGYTEIRRLNSTYRVPNSQVLAFIQEDEDE